MPKIDTDDLDEVQQCLIELIAASRMHELVDPFVLEHGTFFSAAPLPKGIRCGHLGACFLNAYGLLKRHGKRLGLTYVEGYAVHLTLMREFHHAWCVDRHGVVYDRTWGEGAAYFGVEFKTEYVLQTIKQREVADDLYYGFLDDWQYGFPLIRDLGDQPALWKHSPDA